MTFSVIIPCFNSSKTIGRALDSLARQNYSDFEVICVDDASVDDTISQIKLAEGNDSLPLILLRNQENAGPGYSRNRGIQQAQGDYLCFLDSDDFYEDNFLRVLSDTIEEKRSDIVFFGCKQIIGDIIRPRICREYTSVSECMALSGGSLCAAVWKKDLFDGLTIPSINNAEDIAIIPVLISRARCVTTLPDLLYNYIHRSGSLSSTVSRDVCRSFVQSFLYTLSHVDTERFHNEVEFHGIKTVLYGATLNALKAGMPKSEIESLWRVFFDKFPGWRGNTYLKEYSLYKRCFISAVGKKRFLQLRLFSFIHQFILNNWR